MVQCDSWSRAYREKTAAVNNTQVECEDGEFREVLLISPHLREYWENIESELLGQRTERLMKRWNEIKDAEACAGVVDSD